MSDKDSLSQARTEGSDGAGPSAIKRALVEIRELRARIADQERKAREPIAIVGLSIRAPGGVHDAETFSELLWSGRDAISEIPGDRWPLSHWYDENPDVPGKMTTRFGGFVTSVDTFDAEFFGITPAEAASMDPQQRLALELAWEALENAGHAPAGLAETRTGVYLGIANGDYGRALFSRPDLIDPYFSPGNAFSVASGRIAYFLGLRGPAVSIDTACSSSLVALHAACQGLRLGDCDFALAGGVNLILTPEMNVNFSKAGMMARDGRCKTFDASADGYVRGEGGGMIVLRRLSDALADGDQVLALIRGTAVNQDGRTNGLTAPSGPSQEAVVRAALEFARVQPEQIGYVEAHGTGTPLGDPIEVNALAAVLGSGRAAVDPLVIGSVKTNIGHLEAAAGIAGVIKTVIALQRRRIPKHLNFSAPNPYIDWSAAPIEVAAQPREWKPIGGRRLAGVSSFGFSGTNAHVILEDASSEPAVTSTPADVISLDRPPMLLAVSGRDPGALLDLARSYRGILRRDNADSGLTDICFTAGAGRNHFAHRAIVRGRNAAEFVEGLDALIEGRDHARLTRGVMERDAIPRVAFLFPGQGPQYVDMGRSLYETAPVFREAFDACAAALDPYLSVPLSSVVFSGPAHRSVLDETAFAQPAMFAIECSLAALWRSLGIEPVAAMGHSFGEYAAAYVAGAISLADAARMVAARGRLVQPLPRDGAMIVLEASEREVLDAIRADGARASIAAVNGDRNTVISGEREAVERIASQFASRGSRIKRLRVSHAFHSPLIEPVLDAFEREIAGTQYQEPRLTLLSNMTGRVADLALIGNRRYWRDHMRNPVRFADSVRALSREGITHYIEMSPQPVLLSMASECVEGGTWLASLREGQDAWSSLLDSVQALYCAGATIDWRAFDAGRSHRRRALPTYPFRRRRHWIDAGSAVREVPRSSDERWGRLSQTMDRQAEQGPLELNLPSYPRKWECLARLTRAHAADVLRRCGLFLEPGERQTLDSVLAAAHIGVTYRHVMLRWLTSLAAEGLLRQDGDRFIADRPMPEPPLGTLWDEARALFADNMPLLDYVANCARLLEPVMTGQESPLETLFPGGSFELARGLYERSTVMRYINSLAAAAFERIAADLPGSHRLRVLEVGAGTGGTSASLLPMLDAQRTDYLYTDVSDVFLNQARERFARYAFIRYGLFDLEKEPRDQGYEAASFDLIVSANCVHAARNLPDAISRLRGLLAPGGLLVLIESTQHLAYFDMTTGLIEGWQHFTDNLRTDNPLLPADRWIEALRAGGFSAAQAWPASGTPSDALAQHVIVARAPGELVNAGDTVAAAATGKQAETIVADFDPHAAWREAFAAAPESQRIELLRTLVRDQIVRIMKADGNPPARNDRLMDLGMDSLMAVQLRNSLNRALGLQRSLPSSLMFDYPTLDAIANLLLSRLEPAPAADLPAAPGNSAPAKLGDGVLDEASIAEMSDDEIGRLLDQRLGSG